MPRIVAVAAAAGTVLGAGGAARAQPAAVLVPERGPGTVVDVAAGGDVSALARFATGLSEPTAICQGPAGDLFATEYATGEVTIISGGGNFSAVAPFATGLTTPTALHCTDTVVLVAERTTDRVVDISSGGDFTAAAAMATVPEPVALLPASNGKLYAASFTGGVYDITSGGAGVLRAEDDFGVTGTYGLGEHEAKLLAAHWSAGRVINFTNHDFLATAVTFATISDVMSLANSGGQLLALTWSGSTPEGRIYDISAGGPFAQATPFATGFSVGAGTQLAVIPNTCGNGDTEGVEECDDGNDSNTDDCLNDCRDASCHDGFVHETDEQCDDGNLDNTDDCVGNCRLPVCGDGFVHATEEECDDGNDNEADECLSDCTLSTCGDGLVDEPYEECDDANDSNEDKCLNNCRDNRCGDGFHDPEAEECDDGNLLDGDSCSHDCTLASCGDGIIQEFEECDDGNDLSSDACVSGCRLAQCGDGFIQSGEERCDDGNLEPGDGCDDRCSVEFELWACQAGDSAAARRGALVGFALLAVLVAIRKSRPRRRETRR